MINKESLKRTILSCGTDEASFKLIQSNVYESNRRTVKLFSPIAFAFFLILMFASIGVTSLQPYQTVYVFGLILSPVIYIVAKILGQKNGAATNIAMYMFAALLMLVGIFMGTVMSPNELAATYIALMLVVPQLFVDRPWRLYLLIIITNIIFIRCVVLFKNPATVTADVVNAVVFGILSIALSTFSVVNRVKRYTLEYEIRNLAENDQLTGLKNRYCYEQFLKKAESMESEVISCIYVDANGLHELNDTQGHEAGDKMLRTIAYAIQDGFGRDNSYRIGGDEFVAVGVDLENIDGIVSEMKREIEEHDYHVAIGIGIKDEPEQKMIDIIKYAEQEMYRDKSEYYERTGKERRRR